MPTITLPKRRNGIAPTVPKLSLSAEQKRSLSDYIRAKRVANEAAAILEKMKGPALAIVQMAGGTVAMNDAILREAISVSYGYPPTLLRQEDKLKQLKKIMQLDGRARKIEKPCLTMSEVQAAA
jgi:hypothetical protein